MATWPETLAYLRENYLARGDDELIAVQITMDAKGLLKRQRSQMVFLSCNGKYIEMFSPVAKPGTISALKLLQEAGVFAVNSTGEYYGLVHNQLLETVDAPELDVMVTLLAMQADDLEQKLTGKDEF